MPLDFEGLRVSKYHSQDMGVCMDVHIQQGHALNMCV